MVEPLDPPDVKLPVPVHPLVTYCVPIAPATGVVTVELIEVPVSFHWFPVGESYVEDTAK